MGQLDSWPLGTNGLLLKTNVHDKDKNTFEGLTRIFLVSAGPMNAVAKLLYTSQGPLLTMGPRGP